MLMRKMSTSYLYIWEYILVNERLVERLRVQVNKLQTLFTTKLKYLCSKKKKENWLDRNKRVFTLNIFLTEIDSIVASLNYDEYNQEIQDLKQKLLERESN